MVYLFIGEDSGSKDAALARLKQQLLSETTAQFNLDTIHGKDTSLMQLQELLLFFPAGPGSRMIVLRQAQELKAEAKEFLLSYVKSADRRVTLVLDVEQTQGRDPFVEGLKQTCKTVYFREERRSSVFELARVMEGGNAAQSLRILQRLLEDGEKPERLLGGLRAAWQKNVTAPDERRRRMKLLLACDLDIKTGRLKPALVLEKLVVGLCGLRKSA